MIGLVFFFRKKIYFKARIDYGFKNTTRCQGFQYKTTFISIFTYKSSIFIFDLPKDRDEGSSFYYFFNEQREKKNNKLQSKNTNKIMTREK